jgi:phage gp36-like protein
VTYTDKATIIAAFQKEQHVLELLGATVWDATSNAKLNALIDEADAEIDVYLAMAVELPLAVTPAVIKSAATRRNCDYHDDQNPRLTDYKLAMGKLRDVAAGRVLVLPVEREKVGKVHLVSDDDPDPYETSMGVDDVSGM